MSLADEADVDHLAKLCRIKLKVEQKKKFETNLKKVLDYMDFLNEVDTEGVTPCTHVLETMENVSGDDIPRKEPFDKETFFKNAPDQVGGMIKVPPVIQFEEEN